MKTFADKVAVVTGAADGIGLAIARSCVQEHMRVVLADIDDKRLDVACEKLRAEGAMVVAVPTDVSDFPQVQRLAARAQEAFGRVDLLCNNAGVGVDGRLWAQPLEEWRWIFGVNFWGVVHGIQAFIPLMLAQGGPAHVVNTASLAGLNSGPGLAAYRASKHAVVSVSETLHHELRASNSSIQVSVLCPGLVRTRILVSGRRRAPGASQVRADPTEDVEVWRRGVALGAGLVTGTEPAVIAQKLFVALREERLHILTHAGSDDEVRARFRLILGQPEETAGP